MTGVEGAKTYVNDNSSGDLTTTGVQNIVDLEMTKVSSGDTTIQFVDAVLEGSEDAVNLKLDGVQSNAGMAVSSVNIGDTSSGGTAGIETLNVTTTDRASMLVGLNTGASTINVAGDQNLFVADDLEGAIKLTLQHLLVI